MVVGDFVCRAASWCLTIVCRKTEKNPWDDQGSFSIFFGHEGSIAVVEVKDAEDNPRVFLLGMHSKGSPQFLADLSAPLPFPELGTPQVRSIKPESPLPMNPKSNVVVVEDSEEEEKEALVEQILRMRETKSKEPSIQEPIVSKDAVEKRDRWTEGFHEVLRK